MPQLRRPLSGRLRRMLGFWPRGPQWDFLSTPGLRLDGWSTPFRDPSLRSRNALQSDRGRENQAAVNRDFPAPRVDRATDRNLDNIGGFYSAYGHTSRRIRM